MESVLRRSGLCQVGDGEHPSVLCVVDSDIVRVAKPDPAIFEFALPHFDGIERHRIAYVGDNVTMDVQGSTAAGLTPVLFDPFDDAAHLFDGMRIRSAGNGEPGNNGGPAVSRVDDLFGGFEVGVGVVRGVRVEVGDAVELVQQVREQAGGAREFGVLNTVLFHPDPLSTG